MTQFQKEYDLDEFGLPLMNCMTVIAGKNASVTGRVMVGHNEDDGGHIIARHISVPPMDWPQGTLLPAEEGCAAIPQVPHTFGYYWVQLRTEKRGLSHSDSFYNENGVLIVSNSMGTSRESMENPNCLRGGGIAYNLRRVLAERSTSARDGVRILIEMVEQWGYAPSGRAYTIADAQEAFMIQVVHGRHYIGARVPDDCIVMMPNYYNFHTLHDCPEMFYPADLVEYAREQGWYQPAVPGDDSDFDFTRAYQAPAEYLGRRNTMRQRHGQRILSGREWDAEREGYPFCIPAERKVDAAGIQSVLTSHYEGTPDLNERFGPGHSPHDTENTRFICTGTTLESLICVFDRNPLLTTLYTAYGRPCQVPYVPVHPLLGQSEKLEKKGDGVVRMARHLLAEDGALAYQRDIWHRFQTVETAMEMTYCDSHRPAQEKVRTLLKQAQERNCAVVEKARAALQAGQRKEAEALLREWDEEFLEYAVDEMETLPLFAAETEPVANISLTAQEIAVRFRLNEAPGEQAMVFGFAHTHVRLRYARPLEGSLKALEEGRYEVRFPTEVFRDSMRCPGVYEFFLGGRTKKERPFYGRCLIRFVEFCAG